ncbi:Ku protein [Halomonas sp. McH1-25]|uniref:non-homologous end joining protein Ku n=1 Tax=unclassified Halomonas TaxID=2609666 RepID=UPI001EF6907A|nr:Ku protein [Halomonas sp. McH1-25]MCP1342374.1 Ku protein [Halomonas sp. FL8]MCP1360372.1 Ku protein [Halomonas sp. BBD45]MCP1364633.1 Ku protein [Halomonas sp. BBD48]
MPRKQRGKQDDQESRVSGPRPFWSGNITFGLVSLPVGLYPANRSKPVSLRMIDRDGTPLARRYFCEKEERPLRSDELVRGYEVEKSEFIVIEDKELDALAPEKSQEIDLKRFVDVADIDPMYFERAYFLTPDKGITKAYRLLAKSMEDSQRAGIATFVMRGKEYLVAILAEKGILRAETLRFYEEVRTPASVGLPKVQSADSQRVDGIERAIASLSSDTLERSALEDWHSRKIMDRVSEKLDKGEGIIDVDPAEDAEAEQGGEVVDLMQVLKQSLEQGQPPTETSTPRRAPASGNAQKPASSEGKERESRAKKGNERRGAPTHGDLDGLSRNELYERAQALDIPGRSSMSKAQLIRAIRQAA